MLALKTVQFKTSQLFVLFVPSDKQDVPLPMREGAHASSRHSHDVDPSCRQRQGPLAVEQGAACVGLAAHGLRGFQFRFTGGDGCVQLHLSSVNHIEHEAYADDDL